MYSSLQQLQKHLLELPVNERWQLVQVILESLQQDTTNQRSEQAPSRLGQHSLAPVLKDTAPHIGDAGSDRFYGGVISDLVSPPKNLSRLRGIARSTSDESLVSDQDDYADYLTQKYQ